jgi:hypothetical protein
MRIGISSQLQNLGHGKRVPYLLSLLVGIFMLMYVVCLWLLIYVSIKLRNIWQKGGRVKKRSTWIPNRILPNRYY